MNLISGVDAGDHSSCHRADLDTWRAVIGESWASTPGARHARLMARGEGQAARKRGPRRLVVLAGGPDQQRQDPVEFWTLASMTPVPDWWRSTAKGMQILSQPIYACERCELPITRQAILLRSARGQELVGCIDCATQVIPGNDIPYEYRPDDEMAARQLLHDRRPKWAAKAADPGELRRLLARQEEAFAYLRETDPETLGPMAAQWAKEIRLHSVRFPDLPKDLHSSVIAARSMAELELELEPSVLPDPQGRHCVGAVIENLGVTLLARPKSTTGDYGVYYSVMLLGDDGVKYWAAVNAGTRLAATIVDMRRAERLMLTSAEVRDVRTETRDRYHEEEYTEEKHPIAEALVMLKRAKLATLTSPGPHLPQGVPAAEHVSGLTAPLRVPARVPTPARRGAARRFRA